MNWLHGLRQTNWPQAHGKPNDQFTLPENMQQVLDQHAQRPNQPVPSTITQTNIDHASMDGPVQMNHQTQFHYQPGQDPNRYEYLRFAKASRYTGGNASTTVPGYLSYGPAQRLDPGSRPTTQAGVNTQLDNGFQNGQWNLDGPRCSSRTTAETPTSTLLGWAG